MIIIYSYNSNNTIIIIILILLNAITEKTFEFLGCDPFLSYI